VLLAAEAVELVGALASGNLDQVIAGTLDGDGAHVLWVLPSGAGPDGWHPVAPASHPALVCYAARGIPVHRRVF
jgi:hypothetical protein